MVYNNINCVHLFIKFYLIIGSVAIAQGLYFTDSYRPVVMTSPNCTGLESMLQSCPQSTHTCVSQYDVGVICQGK